jgi:glycerol transport system ATP-binding protein
MATIELLNVAHAYVPGEYAVRDINLVWENGVSSALLGPSGCGKTTLLKIISGLLQPTQGDVLLNGERVNHLRPKERNVAQVFQFPVVYETLNVFDNLAFPLRNRNVPEKNVRNRVHAIAELLGLSQNLKKNAASLGAGEKQLISLGRGVVREDIAAILLDEPLTVIDIHQKWLIRRKLKQLQRELGLTMIYVTHDQHEALTFADQVTVMDTGIALQTGSPVDLHEQPAAPFVGYFIGSPGMNLFDASLHQSQLEAGDYRLTLPAKAIEQLNGQNLKLGIRPEFVQVHPSQTSNSFECIVQDVHLTGQSKILDLVGADLTFKARVDETQNFHPANHVWVRFPQDKTQIYVNDRVWTAADKEASV